MNEVGGNKLSKMKDMMRINSAKNRMTFLQRCIEEQVVPKSTPIKIGNDIHPFPDHVRKYLLHSMKQLDDTVIVLKSKIDRTIIIDFWMQRKIDKNNREQIINLERKLESLCNNSRWNTTGNQNIINNLSTHVMTNDETSALALGLKFAVGDSRFDLLDSMVKNYRHGDNAVDTGFVQGLLTTMLAIAKQENKAVPLRYIHALKNLSRNNNILITTADKGGGVVIMDQDDYQAKMRDLLNDNQIYEEVRNGTSNEEAIKFNQKVRKILKRSKAGMKLYYNIEEKPQVPRMRGSPKTHKPNIPLRPITSGIGSAPHRLAKILAKPLSEKMGSISGAHLKNSGDLKHKLRDVPVKNKKLISVDVTALFTNVPVAEALETVKQIVDNSNPASLPLPKRDYLQLIEMCVGFNTFQFNNREYRQKNGMAMGSPLSAVLACLFMESLESGPIRRVIGNYTKWLRYVDDTIVIINRRTDSTRLLDKLNSIHPTIKFTIEEEDEDHTLPFLDMKIHRFDDHLKYSVYRKATNKNDFIHFYSAHDEKTKSGVLIGFFLRALRICDDLFLDDELRYIEGTFHALKYPEAFIIKAENKARKIHARNNLERVATRRVVCLNNSMFSDIRSTLKDVELTARSGQKIKDLCKPSEGNRNIHDLCVVYSIPCATCSKVYIGETHRGLEIRSKEHKDDIRFGRDVTGLSDHILYENHIVNWDGAIVLKSGLEKRRRKALESAYIVTTKETINGNDGSIKISKYAAKVII